MNDTYPSQNLDSQQCAKYMNLSYGTLRNARVSGSLCGVGAPKYKKLGRKVVYEKAVIDDWLAQFENQSNTAA